MGLKLESSSFTIYRKRMRNPIYFALNIAAKSDLRSFPEQRERMGPKSEFSPPTKYRKRTRKPINFASKIVAKSDLRSFPEVPWSTQNHEKTIRKPYCGILVRLGVPGGGQDQMLKSTFAYFGRLWGPLRDPKVNQTSILGPKRDARKRFFIDFSREQRFSHFWA